MNIVEKDLEFYAIKCIIEKQYGHMPKHRKNIDFNICSNVHFFDYEPMLENITESCKECDSYDKYKKLIATKIPDYKTDVSIKSQLINCNNIDMDKCPVNGCYTFSPLIGSKSDKSTFYMFYKKDSFESDEMAFCKLRKKDKYLFEFVKFIDSSISFF